MEKKMRAMRLQDIPQYTSWGNYRINVPWDYLEEWIARETEIDLDPDFQRAHVWTEAQQSAYVLHVLRGGHSGREILFNHPGWNDSFQGSMVIVDGKQRLEAVRRFLRGEVPVLGRPLSDYEDAERMLRSHHLDFIVYVNCLKTRAEVLQWYLDINAGGVIHTEEELEKVRRLLELELER